MAVDLLSIAETMSLSELEQDSAILLELLEQLNRLAELLASLTDYCDQMITHQSEGNGSPYLSGVAQRISEASEMLGVSAYITTIELLHRRFKATEIHRRLEEATRARERSQNRRKNQESAEKGQQQPLN